MGDVHLVLWEEEVNVTTTTNASYLADVAPELVRILANPESDEERLIYADWLEERGEAERAEFIRVQVELASPKLESHEDDELCSECARVRALRSRELELFDRYKCDWFGESTAIHYLDLEYEDSEGQFENCAKSIVRRGFIAEIHAPLAVLEKHLPALVREHPIERVRATDKEPFRYPAIHNYREHWSWWGNDRTEKEDISMELFQLLGGEDPTLFDERYPECRNYPTAEAAHDALSRALLGLARTQESK